MSDNNFPVPEHYVAMFTSNVRAAIVRKGGICRPYVTIGTYTGSEKSQVVNFIGPLEFQERTTPYQDTKLTEVEHKQRWITGREYDVAVLVDRLDTLKMIYDPKNPYVERMREAYGRKEDDIIIAAFFDTAKTGKLGVTATPFDANNIIVHNSTGLLVTKLRSLRKLMKKRNVDLRAERPLIAVSAEEVDDLLGEVAVGSSDYNAVKPLVDGEVSAFMGFTFVPVENALQTFDDTGVVRRCPAWVPSGMHWGNWMNLTITINNRPDKNNIPQIHATFTGGATRLEEEKVFEVDCHE